jgi:hypothetical protein
VSAFIIPRGSRACSAIVLPPGPARPVPKPCIVCRILFGWEHDGCHPASPAAPRCGKYLGDNDATCPQLTCIRGRGHPGRCDNTRDYVLFV